MSQSYNFIILDMASQNFVTLQRQDLPVIICVSVGIAGDLLTLTRNSSVVVSQWISIRMTMEETVSFLMLDLDVIIVIDGYRVGQHCIVSQSLLEFWGHEVVARARAVQDRKVNLKPEEIEHKWNNDQPHCSCGKCFQNLVDLECLAVG